MDNITQRKLDDRAKQDAADFMPKFPAENTLSAWEGYISELESIDTYDFAGQSADSWDWSFIYYLAMELCLAVDCETLDRAEEQAKEFGMIDHAFETGGLHGVACAVAYHIIYEAVSEAIEVAREELIEFANAQIENLEGIEA